MTHQVFHELCQGWLGAGCRIGPFSPAPDSTVYVVYIWLHGLYMVFASTRHDNCAPTIKKIVAVAVALMP